MRRICRAIKVEPVVGIVAVDIAVGLAQVKVFSSPDEVQESLCCHPVVGIGVGVAVAIAVAVGVVISTYKLIDNNSKTHLLTPLIFCTHMPWDKTFQCISKF